MWPITTAANKQRCQMFGGEHALGTLNRRKEVTTDRLLLDPMEAGGSTVGPNRRMGVRVSVSAQLHSNFKCESALSVNLGLFPHKDVNSVILKFSLVNFLVFAAFLSSSMFLFLPHH